MGLPASLNEKTVFEMFLCALGVHRVDVDFADMAAVGKLLRAWYGEPGYTCPTPIYWLG